jgi:hypothetical protein
LENMQPSQKRSMLKSVETEGVLAKDMNAIKNKPCRPGTRGSHL